MCYFQACGKQSEPFYHLSFPVLTTVPDCRQVIPDYPMIRESMCPAGYPKNTRPTCTLGTSRTNPPLSYQGIQVPVQTWTPSPHSWLLDSMWCLDLHHHRLKSVSSERARTHDKRATSLPYTHTQVCAQDNKSVTCLASNATTGS